MTRRSDPLPQVYDLPHNDPNHHDVFPGRPRLAPPVVARVFVYGTLLEGEGNHRLLMRATLVGPARTRAEFTFHDLGGCPGLVSESPSELDRQHVVGELYDVDAQTLADLDRLEGHPRFYRRTEIVLDDGSKAETYILPARYGELPRIPSGSWREHRKAPREYHHARRSQV
jgi:gamma-glutamylaminecyclotransferase